MTDPAHAESGRTAQQIARLIVRARFLWLALAAGLTALALAQIHTIWPPNPDARVFFAAENPDRQALDRFEETFSKNDILMIVVEAKGGDVFTPDVLGAIGALTERSWYLPYVRRVDSLTNFQHSYAEGDDLVVRDLVVDPASVTEAEAAEARAIAMDRIELVDFFVSAKGDVALVTVNFTLPQVEPTKEVPEIVADLRQMIAEVEAAHPAIDTRLTGGIMINNQFAQSGQDDGKTLLGPMFLVILAVVGLAIRSVTGTLAVLVVIVLSAAAGLGALGWTGVPLNSVTVLSPLYIMTLAVASCVHILSACRRHMPETADRKVWVERALADHMGAIVIACATTAVGFASLNFSIAPPFRQLGNIVAVGVLAAMVYTLTVLPALITLLPIRRTTRVPARGHAMERVGEFVIRWWRYLLPGTALLAVLMAAGMTRIALEDDFLRYFDTRYEFRQDTDFTERRLTGVNNLDWPLSSGEPQGVTRPDFLREVAAFAEWLREQPETAYVRTLTDTIQRLNMNMHGDDPAHMRLPDSYEEAAQYLFLYELSLGYGMDLTDQIDIDRRMLRVSQFMANVTTADMRALTLRAGEWLRDNAPIIQAAWQAEHPDRPLVTPTGIVHVFNLISYRDVRDMLGGTAVAIVLISAIIMLALRDVRIGLISLLPNMIPAAMAFGLWGYFVGNVTLAIAVVLAATLGIVVDDTVHFLSKYARARKAGRSAEDAVRYAFRTVGMALFITTISLVAGFAVLAQSGFAVNGDMAKLTAITITLALLADFILLPSLLIWLAKRRPDMTRTPRNTRPAVTALLAVLAIGLAAPEARAESAEAKGLAIAEESDRRDLGFGDYVVDGEMVLRDQSGRESRRVFENLVLERPDPGLGDLGIIVFSKPRDIRGTGLLTHANIEPQDDDQWLYLPAVKRVKRISSSNRTGKFVSSEFSYEDLGSQEVADYDYKWLRDEPCPTDAALTCHVVESYPKNPKSGYSKRIAWTDNAEYRLQYIEFYNRRGDLEKTLTFTGYRQYLGQYWRAAKMQMVNKQTGKETDLIWKDYRFRTGLSEGDFTASRLQRMAR